MIPGLILQPWSGAAGNRKHSHMPTELEFARAQIVALQQRLAAETTARIAAESRAERHEAQITALRKSLSWQVTKPLRAFKRSRSRSS